MTWSGLTSRRRAAVSGVQAVLGRWPRAYIGLMHVKYRGKRYRRRIVDGATALVIEGFPRSGTSFAIRAFAFAQEDEVKVASHAHHGAQVRRGVSLNIPVLVVIRQPSQCLPSFFALREEARRLGDSQPALDIAEGLRRYAAFHEDVLRVVNSVVVAKFEDVVTNYGLVIGGVNDKFGTNFTPFDHSGANVEEVFQGSGSHLSPSQARQADNLRGRELYAASPADLRMRAERAYDQVLAHALHPRGLST